MKGDNPGFPRPSSGIRKKGPTTKNLTKGGPKSAQKHCRSTRSGNRTEIQQTHRFPEEIGQHTLRPRICGKSNSQQQNLKTDHNGLQPFTHRKRGGTPDIHAKKLGLSTGVLTHLWEKIREPKTCSSIREKTPTAIRGKTISISSSSCRRR